jgi:hypothetical protein
MSDIQKAIDKQAKLEAEAPELACIPGWGQLK